MRNTGLNLRAMFALMLLGAALPVNVRAAIAILDVCNHGKISIEVFVAKKYDALNSSGWVVESKHIAPGDCERVYTETTYEDLGDGSPAYIGFGFTDAKGQFTAGTVAEAPDIGFVNYAFIEAKMKGAGGHKVLTKGDKKICVLPDKTLYRTEGDLETDCAQFRTGDNEDLGNYIPLTTAFYFRPQASKYYSTYGQGTWAGGEYTITVAAVRNEREIAVVAGSGGVEPELDARQAAHPAWKQLLAYASNARQKRIDAENKANPALEAERKKRIEAQKRYDEEQKKQWNATLVSPGAYEQRWKGENVVVRGTVSRVQVKEGFPTWVTVFFKESPDATFVVCSPAPRIFSQFGENFSDLVDKTLEVAGQVEGCMCAGKTASIRVVESSQLRLPSPEQLKTKATEAGGKSAFPERQRPATLTIDDLRRAQETPMTIGKVDVRRFCALGMSDSLQWVTKIFGQPTADRGMEQVFGPGGHMTVGYVRPNTALIVRRVTVDSSDLDWVKGRLDAFWVKGHLDGSHAPPDPLLALFGQDEAAAIALLGPSQKRESKDGQTKLYWSFPLAGYPAGDANADSNQTLALGFKAGSGCNSMTVIW